MGIALAQHSRSANAKASSSSSVAAQPARGRSKAIVVSHTHWDREWYLTQKQFQFMLGDTLDAVIDALDHEPGFKCFMADGQTSIIEDYLEIRPANRARLHRLILQHRMFVGPWYTMPDLWLPSGESLIRNLLRGRLDCESLGAQPDHVGYVPDSFGHIEQMPQILNGFGIDTYFFTRGKAEQSEPGEVVFDWVGPDGRSRLTVHHIPSGYANAVMLPPIDSDALKSRLERILHPRALDGNVRAAPSLLLNGIDHIWVQRDLPKLLKKAADLLPDVDFEIGSLQTYVNAFVEFNRGRELPVRQGCLRDPMIQATHLHGSWSSRVDNKLANAAASATLEGLAEPAAAMLLAAGGPNRRPDLAVAWKSVLLNHAHDSICGCSADAVHADVNARFRHADELGEMIAADALRKLSGDPKRPMLVRLAGLGGAPALCEFVVDAPDESALNAIGNDGHPLTTQLLGRRRLRRQDCIISETGDSDGQRSAEFVEHRMLALLPPAQPMECQKFELKPAAGASPAPLDIVQASDRWLENALLRVEVCHDATLRLHHKPSGQVYERVLELLDDADAGGGYFFKPLPNDVCLRSSEAKANVECIERGPLRGKIRIALRWLLPERLNRSKTARQVDGPVECEAEWLVSLSSGAEQLDCTLRFTNRAIEHRVRVNVPLPFQTDRASVERAFVVTDEDLSRFIAEPGQNSHPMRNWVACADERGGIAFVGKGLHEFAIEQRAGVGGGNSSDLRVTLLRSVPYVDLCGAWRTPDAELRRTLSYGFALVPFAGDWRSAGIAERAHRIVHRSAAEVVGDRRTDWDHLPHATIRMEERCAADSGDAWLLTSSHRSAWRRHFGDRDGWRRRETAVVRYAPSSPQLVALEGEQALLSCVKPAERAIDGGDDASRDLIVRFYSLAKGEQTATLRFGVPIAGIWESDLLESAGRALETNASAVKIHIRPFEIATVRVRTASSSDLR